jgi:hypothetical protein
MKSGELNVRELIQTYWRVRVCQRCAAEVLSGSHGSSCFCFVLLTRFPICLQTKFALCEGHDGNECDVLIFPDMKRFRWVLALTTFLFSVPGLALLVSSVVLVWN